MLLKVYPSTKASFKFGKKFFEAPLEKLNMRLDQALSKIRVGFFRGSLNFSPPAGSIAASSQWKECGTNHLAFWTFEVAAGMDPLLEVKGGLKAEIGRDSLPPNVGFFFDTAFPGQDIKASVFVGMVGAVSLVGKFGRNECGGLALSPNDFVTLSGKIGVTGEVELKLGTVVGAKAALTSTITASGFLGLKGPDRQLVLNKAKVDWDGLVLGAAISVPVTILFLDGEVEFSEEWVLIDPTNLLPETDIPLEAPETTVTN
jgi:hypothetical protein